MSKPKKVLLLGGTGAMGVYLVPELIKLGYEVFVTSRSSRESSDENLVYLKGDAKDDGFLKSILDKGDYVTVFDFMVYHTEEFKKRVNFLLDNTNHYVFLSSYRVYAGSSTPLTEESPRLLDTIDDVNYLKTDEYALTKARQEDVLKGHDKKNWTIVRPAITYSSDRFQLGTLEANEFLYRALNGKKVIFPTEMLDKKTTMSWAGDVARMIAGIASKKNSYGEIYTVSTSETHTWREVIDIYKSIVDLEIHPVPLEDFKRVIGRPYQILYDRMYDRVIDNTKILKTTDIKSSELTKLSDGLKLELSKFVQNPQFGFVDKNKDREIDYLISPSRRIKNPRSVAGAVKNNLRRVKRFVRSKQESDGVVLSLGGYYNYGGLIQRYALQKFLRKNGYNFKVLDIGYMRNYGAGAGDRSNLETFAGKYLDQEYFRPNLSGFHRAYIVGSDQVWRDYYGGNWSKFGNFFLSFVKNPRAKRIAYAASFGVDDLTSAGINARNRKKINSLIRRFDAISVREASAVKLVEQLGGQADVNLDPTLLLDANDYSKLVDAHTGKLPDISPLFSYLLDATESKREVVSRIQNQLKVKTTDFQANSGNKLPSMEYWLKGFRDSEMVVTDSFHGIVFSIINKRQFIALGNNERGLSRMVDLLRPLGLENRIITEDKLDTIDSDMLTSEIDWSEVYERLDKKRQESAEWLLKSLR